jgi:hypothetical protein
LPRHKRLLCSLDYICFLLRLENLLSHCRECHNALESTVVWRWCSLRDCQGCPVTGRLLRRSCLMTALEDKESVRMTTFLLVSELTRWSAPSVFALISAVKLEQISPPAEDKLVVLPPGYFTYTPLPPFLTASVADPSVWTWVHSECGYLRSIISNV